ncbi:MAG: amino acid adenylation domain-containing protein, partial [Bacteroidota bacterium]
MKIKSSYHQQRLWFINHFEKDHLYDGNPIYHNVPLAISIKRQVSEVAVRNAFASLLRDHEILRTKLVVEEGSRICQKVVPIEEVDLAKLLVPTEDVFARAELLRSLPFDDGDFLLRGYYELSEQGCHLFLVLHHAIVDYHSVKKIRAFFLDALERDVAVPATKIVPYQRFSNWQNELGQDELEPLLFYWKAQLVDNPVLYFPTDHKREHIHVYKSQLLRTEISKDGMARFCDEQGGSIQVFLLAMYKMILSKFTALPDVVLGTVMPLRPESANVLLGPVDNLVVLRSSIDPHKTVAEHHREVMRTWEMAKKYKSMPFDKLVSEINPKKDRSRTALFDLLFQYDVVDSQMDEEEWEINSRNLGWGKYDLNLLVSEKEDSLLLSLTYNGLYFEAYTMKAFLTAYEKLIAESLQKPELLLEEFDLLTEEESQVLLSSQQGELPAFDRRASIPTLFCSQLLKHEDRTALVGSSFDPLSYKELDVLSNQLANLLQGTFGIQSGDKIAVTLPKTDELIIALLALLKLGATYVPMDAAHPEERKQFILSDSDCKLTIDRAFTNSWMGKAKEEKTSFDSREVDSDATAYIIYTSGTTGKPKGVRVSHRNVVALLHSCFEHIKVDAKDTWVQFHSHCFDFSVWEIFGCLLSGGQLLMVTPAEARDLDALCQLMNAQDATIFSQTPSAFYNFMVHESLTAPLRYVIFGGEMLLPNKLKEWHDKHPDVKLINMYGITETTVHVTLKELGPGDLNSELSNIGKPLSFAQLYILNEQRQLLPYGRVGEMYVAGHGVAQGYLNRPELDRERFLPDVYLARGRMYRTGDKARWLPNGELEFIGRVDRQVKIRGYRIELDEIENAIAQFSPSIQQVAVDLKTVHQEDVIVAYYASTEAMEKTDIRNFLQSQLPEYMLPAFFVALESIQLTSNGKVDRKALPEVNREDLLGREYVAPDNETEQQIAAIWQEVLGLKQLSATDDFFELGGHSLKIIMVKNRVRDLLQLDLDISNFFDHSILRDLAKFVDENSTTASTPLPALVHLPVAERYESSKAQKRLWFIHQLRKNRSAYNIDFALRVGGTFHQQAFQQAVDGMLERHEILRTIFPDAQQLITPPKRCDIDVRRKEPGTSVKETLLAIAALPFDLEKGPLFKVHILEESDQVRYILFNIHHIIFDDWSVAIFIKELLTSYEAFVHNTIPSLQPIVYQYKAYAHWKNEMAKSDLYKASELYWLARFDELPQALELPCDFPRPKRKTFRGNNLFRELEQDWVEEIQTKIGADRLSSVSFFLACFKLLLYKYSHQSDLVVGMPVSDRDHRALENQIGLYLNVIAVRSNLQPSLSLKEALQQEHQSLLEALNHKLYPLDELVEKLVLPRDVSRSPLFDVMFAHQYEDGTGFEQGEWNLGNLQLEKIQLNPPTSKFDLL